MISLILTIHNKAQLLNSVLHSLCMCQNVPCKLIIIFDGCDDNSEKIFKRHQSKLEKFFRIEIIHLENVFETKANNAGLKLVEDEYAIIMQDDTVIREYGWMQRLIKPLETFEDVFAVTSRCAHDWVVNHSSKYINVASRVIPNSPETWCDLLSHVNHTHRFNTPRNHFTIRSTVNRGPLALRTSVVEKFGYLDEAYSPQDMDDHDLCFRIRKNTNLHCGLYWINYLSRDEWGGTRENGSPKKWLLKAQHKNSFLFYERYKDDLEREYFDHEIRIL